MIKITPDQIQDWKIARKTRSIKSKPLINLLVDRSVSSKFLVDTLEGKEPLGDGVVICVGEAGDVWQQMPKKLLAKYDVTAIDADGWMVCTPKPDNAVDCFEVTREFSSLWTASQDFYIIGAWGETIGDEKNVQRGKVGDFICRNRDDHSDVWIVRRSLFLNTYNLVS
jgi:hypothetical protein